MKKILDFLRAEPLDVAFLVCAFIGFVTTVPGKTSLLFAILGLIELARLLRKGT